MVANSLDITRILDHGVAPVRLIEFGPMGLMATADVDMKVVVWRDLKPVTEFDLRSRTLRQRALDRLRSMAFTPDGEGLYLCSGSRLLLMALGTGQEQWRHRAPEWWPFLIASPQTVATLQDNGIVASFDNGSFERFDEDHRSVFRIKDPESPVWFRLDEGAGTIVGCDGYHVCVWNLASGEKVQRTTLEEHGYAFEYAPLTGLAAVRDAGSLVLRSVLDGVVLDRIPLPPGPPIMTFDPSGRRLAYACGQTVVQRNEAGDTDARVLPDTARLVTMKFDESGHLWTGHADGKVYQWSQN